MLLREIQPYIRLVNNYSPAIPYIGVPRIIYDYEFMFIMDGFVDISYGDKIYTLKKNDLMFLRPGVVNHIILKPNSNLKTHCIHFDFTPPPASEDFNANLVYSRTPLTKDLTDMLKKRRNPFPEDFNISSHTKALYSLSRHFRACYLSYVENTTSSSFRLKENFYAILSHLANISEKKHREHFHPAVFKTIEILEHNFMNKINVAQLAQKFGLSPNYLGNIFKTEIGQSINAYLLNVRLQKAKELLLTTNDSIGEIAYNVGFFSPFYFSTCFERSEGVPPSVYRNLMQNHES